ncbi:hypothetical protein N0V83_007302 [Neocucurbitaria cava]|uniref:PLD phosphodiesterase domain-containing protein n=1 Tax=Neocucurbitaria cava TaxID=798079 RepID=A0A9W8Y4Y4_9PLEO|nr:hypothetical protein N0V83_007302 [Neocucurbitaria cava]
MASRISDKIFQFCTDPNSVSALYARDPTQSPEDYAKKLYGGQHYAITEKKPPHERRALTKEDMDRARQCGNWGKTEPSELFLHCFHDALCSLEHDHLAGVISPSLMGSHGIIPLTILAPLPDIARHMANLIARAEKEVFLATNFWVSSNASRLITDSLLELSKRAGERGQRVVVKVMYDRGNIKQVVDNHQIMSVSQYTSDAVKLPSPDQIPHIDMEVQNFHRPMLGTFHSKYMVVDRRIAIVQSNNIQDNDNLEMMTHLEGAIVDSFYDVALLSWERAPKPPLPCHNDPAMAATTNTFSHPSFLGLFDENGKLKVPSAGNPDSLMGQGHEHQAMNTAGDPHYDTDIGAEIRRLQSALSPQNGETQMSKVSKHLNLATKLDLQGTAPDCPPDEEMTPMIPHKVHEPFPIAMVNRRPWGAINHACVNVPQNEAWLSALRNAKSSVFIQTPDLNAEPLIPAIKEAVRRGVEVTYYVCLGYNDSGELLPFQGGTNEMVANKLYLSLEDDERQRLHVHYYVAKDQIRPIHNKFKKRSCHVKLMIVDGHVGIQGNGNQDTQSWYHSMEVNIMIDSYEVCAGWLEGIARNQNTHQYGAASKEDGIWRDESGNEAEGAIGKDPGRFSWAKGIVGAVQRVRGAGQ